MNILKIPEGFIESWIPNIAIYHQDQCSVNDADGCTTEELGCKGLSCTDCVFLTSNLQGLTPDTLLIKYHE